LNLGNLGLCDRDRISVTLFFEDVGSIPIKSRSLRAWFIGPTEIRTDFGQVSAEFRLDFGQVSVRFRIDYGHILSEFRTDL